MNAPLLDRRRLSVVATLCALPLLVAGCGAGSSSLDTRVDALLQRSMYKEATALVEGALRSKPVNAHALLLLGRCRLAVADFKGAQEAFGAACAADTNQFALSGAAYRKQAQAWFAHDQVENAAQAIAASDAISPKDRERARQAWLDAAEARAAENPERGIALLVRGVAFDSALRPRASAIATRIVSAAPVSERAAMLARADALGSLAISENAGLRARRSIRIAPTEGWVTTPISVARGDTVELAATGLVRAEAAHAGWVSEPCGPAGWQRSRMDWLAETGVTPIVAAAPRMALLARAGQGAVRVVGSHSTLVADQAGLIALCINDVPAQAQLAAGSFQVEIESPLETPQSGPGSTRP